VTEHVIACLLAQVDGQVYVALSPEERDRYDAYEVLLESHDDALHFDCVSELAYNEVLRRNNELEDELNDALGEVERARRQGFDQALDRVSAGGQKMKDAGPREEISE
jgi:hypothetical protein